MASDRPYKGALKVNLSFISTEEPKPAYNQYWGDFIDDEERRQIFKRPRKYDIHVYVRIKPEFWHEHWKTYPELAGKAVGFLHPLPSTGKISQEKLRFVLKDYAANALREETFNHVDYDNSFFIASVGYDNEYIEKRLKLSEL